VASPQEPGERPNRTRLDRPPGARYDQPAQAGGDATAQRPFRGLAWAAVIAIGGAAAIVALGGALAVSLGLVVVAFLIGRLVRLALRTRPAPAVTITLLGILVGQVGIWLYARSEGGVLGLVDYLGQAFGWLVVAQLVVGAAVAWWTSR
jgi:hypothetical protein